MNEFSETSPLSGRRNISPSKQAWIVFGAILLFAFLAFVFATVSFAATKKLNTGVSNNFYDHQGGLIQQTYAISQSSKTFEAGTVLSFCDGATGAVCPGLGPRWNQSLTPASSLSPAIAGAMVQLNPDLAIYAWAAASSPNTLRVVAIRTSSDPPAYTGPSAVTIALSDPIDLLELRACSDNTFVIAYDIHNSSYLIGGSATTTTPVKLGSPVYLFDIPATLDPFEMDLLVLQREVIVVSYGQNSVGAQFLAFTLADVTLTSITLTRNGFGLQITNEMASVDLGHSGGLNYFLMVTGSSTAIGTYAFAGNTLTISALKSITFYDVIFETVGALSLFNGYVAVFGVQIANLDIPLTVSMVIQWSTVSPYLTTFFPSNLLETQDHQALNFQLSACYAPSTTSDEPQGELYFTYVDSLSDKAKLIRAKIAHTSTKDVQLLPSPPIDISTFKYSQFGPTMAPLVACPSSAGVLVAYQYLGTYINSFVWEGGYRFAGLAQEPNPTKGHKSKVGVIRQGISAVHQNLQPGYSYYLTNEGHLRPHTSLTELFTPTAFSTRVGVALSSSELLLDDHVFEYLTRGH